MSGAEAPSISRRIQGLACLLALGLTLFFYSTAPKASASSDPFANILTAWTVARHGSVVLQDHSQLIEPEAFFQLTWIVEGKDGPVSLFPPGAALLAAPLYTIDDSELNPGIAFDNAGALFTYGVPPIEPSVLIAAGSTAIASALLFLALRRLGNSGEAMVGALVFALATGAWSVASQALWQHGPAMMWLAVGLWTTSRARELAWIPAILTRPMVAVMVVARTIHGSFVDRRWRAVLIPGACTVAGTGLLLLFNKLYFGSWSPLIAYEQNPVLLLWELDLIDWIGNIFGALVDPRRGLLMISPFLLVLLPGLKRAWRIAPAFVRSSAFAGLMYLLIHYKAHHFAGGDLFMGYRYPLEGLLAASPLLFLSYQTWVKPHRSRLALLAVGVITAIGLQAIGVANPYSF